MQELSDISLRDRGAGFRFARTGQSPVTKQVFTES
jgi:hypothetical protein